MGVWRGKKGSSVFYYLRNSRNAQKQGIRERVYEISNPQTNGQTDQRMKMLPLQRLGAKLGVVVRRSWEGVEYGGKTWQKFLSANMGQNSTLPFVDKDDDRTIPGDIQISKGSLDTIEASFDDTDLYYDINVGDQGLSAATVGALSALILQYNSNIIQGDQLTFLWCSTDAQNSGDVLIAKYHWNVQSIIVDPTSTENLPADQYTQIRVGSGKVVCEVSNARFVCAGGIIHSRQDGNSYRRSTQRLEINSTLLADWFSSARHSAARRSYQRTVSTASTNWPVDPNEEMANSVPGSYTISGLTGNKASCNGKSCWVRRDEETNELVAVYTTSWSGSESNYLVDRSSNQAMEYTVDMSVFGLAVSDVAALASLPTIQWTGEPTS